MTTVNSSKSSVIRIPAEHLAHVRQLMLNLSADLKQVGEQIECGQSVALPLLECIETEMLHALEFISPEMRSAIAKAQRLAEIGTVSA